MKRILFVICAVLALASCAPKVQYHPDWTYNSVVYEVNIRQFSEEGTFKGVEAQLPRLKDLGVDVLWLMPMYEVGVEGRKGTLGSYYAISDYKKVNPEFGTMEGPAGCRPWPGLQGHPGLGGQPDRSGPCVDEGKTGRIL